MLRHIQRRVFQAAELDGGTKFSFDDPKGPAGGDAPADPTIAGIVDEGVEGMPQVNEQVLAQIGGGNDDIASELDADGVAYDSAIHATGADGKGVKTQGGKWRKKRGAKGVSSTLAGGRANQSATSKSVETDEEKRAKAVVVGAAGANAVFLLGQAIGGEEWAPLSVNKAGEVKLEDYDERAMMERAITDYCVATGKTDFPPSIGLGIAITAYMLPRFRMPKTQSRMQAAKEWIVQKYVSFRMRKKGGSDGAQSASRDDGKRENVTRQASR